MAVNLFQTGVSGLLAAQQQLATTGHNLTNVNTPGYSRQTAIQNSSVPLQEGGNFFGSGTYVIDTKRIYNQFTYKEQIQSNTFYSYAESLNFSLDNLDSLMSYSSEGIKNSIVKLYQSVNSIADTPNDLGLRKIALSHAENLTNDFNALDASMSRLNNSLNEEFGAIANKITELSSQIANMNRQILDASNNRANGQPNDLLDKRDQLVEELSQYTKVTTLEDSNKVITVMVGLNGNTLVAGITPLKMQVVAGNPDPERMSFEIVGNNATSALQGSKMGGKLQAMFEYRDVHLRQARAEIDQLALGIADVLNNAQSEGLNLQGIQGQRIFNDVNDIAAQQQRVAAYNGNSGTLQSQVAITDMSLLPTDEFQLNYDGANYNLINTNTGATTVLGAAGSGTYNTGLGFDFIETAGAPAAGDRFLIRPTISGASRFDVAMREPSGIAASTAVEVIASPNNISEGDIVITNVVDPVTARAYAPLRIEVLESPVGTFNYQIFNDTTNALITGAGYTPPSQSIDLPPLPSAPAFTIEIKGSPSGLAPNGPEVYRIVDAFGEGNGDNALAMGLTQQAKLLNGARESFSQALANTTADIGTSASTSKNTASTAETLFEQATARHQEISGVNLDEEAANLLQFQQAYQAASQIINTANTIFDTLFAAVR